MTLQVEIEEKPAYFVARYSGSGTLSEACQSFEAIAERCRSASKRRALLDISGAQLTASFADRVDVGMRAFVFAQHGIRLTMACAPEQVDPGRIGELVAQNRGVRVRVFTSLPEAEAWLLA